MVGIVRGPQTAMVVGKAGEDALPQQLFGATVRVYADTAHGNALPSYFAKAFGVIVAGRDASARRKLSTAACG